MSNVPYAPRATDGPDKEAGPSALGKLFHAFTPNQTISPIAVKTIIAIQILLFFAIWIMSPFEVLPKPAEVLSALQQLWTEQGLADDLLVSFTLNIKALAITTVVTLALSYLTVMPFFRTIAGAISKGRFLSLAGFTLLFTLMVGGGQPLKLMMLVFGMTVFFVTSMAAIVAEIPKDKFDHARTLRMGEWRVVWEVVILGTADKAFEAMRQNAAIGWMMLTMVEGVVRSEGGIGTMLLNQQKHFHIAHVYAVQIVILMVGLFQDYLIGVLRKLVCPYADLTLERK